MAHTPSPESFIMVENFIELPTFIIAVSNVESVSLNKKTVTIVSKSGHTSDIIFDSEERASLNMEIIRQVLKGTYVKPANEASVTSKPLA